MHPTQNPATDPGFDLGFEPGCDPGFDWAFDLATDPKLNPDTDTSDAETDLATAELIGTPAETLRCAAAYIEVHGFERRNLYGSGVYFPPACAEGAIRAAVYGYPNEDPVLSGELGRHVDAAMVALADHLDRYDDDSFDDPVDMATNAIHIWNDAEGQTKATVTGILREAADAYERQHSSTVTGSGGAASGGAA